MHKPKSPERQVFDILAHMTPREPMTPRQEIEEMVERENFERQGGRYHQNAGGGGCDNQTSPNFFQILKSDF